MVGEGIPKKVDTKLSDHFWEILEKRLFGITTGKKKSYKGNIQVLEMKANELREITRKQFTKLRKSGVLLFPKWVPNDNITEATPGSIFIVPEYPGDGDKVKKQEETSIGGRGDKSMFKIRLSYEWTKQDLDGHQVRITPKESYGMTPKSAPFKVFIELGGKDSVIHDENWLNFVDKGLVRG